ncbi:MAG TPA: c-type cytochrome [Steroidobacteraceae bacterium]|jgi:mono/diheme cytochrome c family protein|nr:c-type cytochrome [Steroidobacteraceae bacterium]
MGPKLKRFAPLSATVAVAVLLIVGTSQLRAQSPSKPQGQSVRQPESRWSKVSVQMPASAAVFPGGEGAVIANAQCLICHSQGMVSRQPALTQGQWKDTINKMRTAYGAPLPAEQVDALAAYLTTLIPNGEAAIAQDDEQRGPAGLQEQPATAGGNGAEVFAARCAACHQSGGTGIPGVFPPLAGSNWVTGPHVAAIRILLHGVQGTLTVNGTAYSGAMPGFASQLSDEEIAAVLSYVRSQWGNQAAPVGAVQVTAERAATTARSEPWNGDADLTTMK